MMNTNKTASSIFKNAEQNENDLINLNVSSQLENMLASGVNLLSSDSLTQVNSSSLSTTNSLRSVNKFTPNRYLSSASFVTVNAQNDTLTTAKNKSFIIDYSNLLANDILLVDNIISPNAPLTITGFKNVVNGRIITDSSGNKRFKPNTNFVGIASFQYTVSDGNGNIATATVTVNVQNITVNAQTDTLTTTKNQSFVINNSTLLANDSLLIDNIIIPNSTLTIIGFKNPINGTLTTDSSGNKRFKPNTNFVGIASFQYTVREANGNVGTATVTVNVQNVNVNAQTDTLITTKNQSFIINNFTLLANDSLLINNVISPNAPLTITGFKNAINGRIITDSSGKKTFKPNTNFVGIASFQYTVRDVSGNTGTTTVIVDVQDFSLTPQNDFFEIKKDRSLIISQQTLLLNDAIGTNNLFSIVSFQNAVNGQLILDNTGKAILFTPNSDFTGTATFNYTLSDGNGNFGTATVTVNVTSPPLSNNVSPIGMNLAGFADYTTSQPLTDIFKASRAWISQADYVWDTNLPIQIDANGWVKTLDGLGETGYVGTFVSSLLTGNNQSQSGEFVVLYDGQGVMEYSFDAQKISSTQGRDLINITNGGHAAYLKIKETNPQDYIRNIRIIPKELENNYDVNVQPFNPDYLERIQPFDTFRFMDWMQINGSTQQTWDDRPEMTDASWTQKGTPVELMVNLANLTNTNPWFCMPAMADDQYITNFATYVKNNLNPNLKVYVEYSNEVWNYSFMQGSQIEDMANTIYSDGSETTGDTIKGWTPQNGTNIWGQPTYASQSIYADSSGNRAEAISGYVRRMTYFGRRTAEIARTWDSVFGSDKERVIGVLGGQAAGTFSAESALAEAERLFADNTGIDAIAIAPYFGHAVASQKNEATLQSWLPASYNGEAGVDISGALNNLFDELTQGGKLPASPVGGAMQESINWINSYATLTQQKGLSLIAYEGGPHLAGYGSVQNNNAITGLFREANSDPRMGTLVTQLLDGWKNAGGDLFAYFNDIGQSSRYGSWGALDTMNSTNSPKYDALIQFIQSQQGSL